MQRDYIDSSEKLQHFCQQLSGKPWLCIDTEFLRETTYYPKLCLIQIAADDIAACIDPLVIEDLSPLWQVIYQTDVTKVLHAARQDLEILFHLRQQLPTPIFDTQPAAAILGLGDQIGYAPLVDKLLGIRLDKGHSRTDWSIRPLDTKQIDYAFNDVIYLAQVYEKLLHQLQQQNRLHWLAQDFQMLSEPDLYQVEPQQAWKKVKGRQPLRGIQYAILQKLAQWRETEAINRNKPRRHVLKDEILIDICRRPPKDLQQLNRIRGFEHRDSKAYGQILLELIEQGQQMPKDQWPREKIPAKPSADQEALLDMLTAALRLIANKKGLTPASIGNRKELQQLINGDSECELLKGWRANVAGKQLQQLISGNASLTLDKGKMELKTAD